MSTPTRHNSVGPLGADDDDDQTSAPHPRNPMLPKEETERIAWQRGFAQAAPKASAAPAPRQQRRYTTGRNQQINVKATAETIEQFYRIADEMRVPLGEVLARALEALEKASK